MLEFFGYALGTPLQGGIFAAVLTMLGLVWRSHINKQPEMARAANERLRDEAGTEKEIRDEYALSLRAYRDEVHKLNNSIAKLMSRQSQLEKLLMDALSTSSTRRDQMTSMMNLIDLLISEIERIDKDSIIIPQARALLQQMRLSASHNDPAKSVAMNNAEHALQDAERTVFSTGQAIEGLTEEEG